MPWKSAGSYEAAESALNCPPEDVDCCGGFPTQDQVSYVLCELQDNLLRVLAMPYAFFLSCI
jgi:hypothetical protein